MSWYGRVVVSVVEKDKEKRKKIKEFLNDYFGDVEEFEDTGEILVNEEDNFYWGFVEDLKKEIKKLKGKEDIKSEFKISVWYLEEPDDEIII